MSKITHLLAVLAAAVVTFSVTPAGQALIHQYPILSGIAGTIGAIWSLYRNPTK